MHETTATRRAARTDALAALALAALALVPRAAGLADFITTDEAYHWIDRTQRFADAVAAGRWADTLLTGHPGVTVMWLGSLGLLLESAFGGAVGPMAHLAWLRLPIAALHAIVVAAAYLLLRQLIGRRAAVWSGVLWALSPYLIAHGRLLHLDALLTDFVTLSLLLLLVSGGPRPRPTPLLLSGAAAGLALLTKGPALILLPYAGLALFVQALAATWQGRGPLLPWLARQLARSLWRYLAWLACALAVVGLLWPAFWSSPAAALARYAGEISDNGGRPNGDGQFFLGRAVADPGPLFYPAADLYRTTPAMLGGLAAGTGLALAAAARPTGRAMLRGLALSQAGRALLLILGLALFWTLVMAAGPKKFDRYTLPTWPALIILSAVGWCALLRRAPWRRAPAAALALLLAAEGAQAAWYHPYYLSYYNPLLGGGAAAQRIFLVGWGEGMDQVGAFLRAQPDIGYGPVLSALGPTLQPFVPVDVRDVTDFGRLPANYAVVYRESVQREADPTLYAALQTTAPLHTVTVHGIDYAVIYQLPRPFETPLDASFGEALRLRGFTLARAARRLTLTPAWDVRARPAGDYRVFLHLLDAQGRRVAQVDVPPGGGDAPPTSAWEPGRQVAVPLPLDLPEGLPPGEYQLVMGLYDAAGQARLPLRGGVAANPTAAGGDALLVASVRLP
jgi:4-amino-4-deoxy-L-arabinose transferase-like glycosyltransferase